MQNRACNARFPASSVQRTQCKVLCKIYASNAGSITRLKTVSCLRYLRKADKMLGYRRETALQGAL